MGDNADHEALCRMLAAATGAVRRSLTTFEWDISNACENPVRFSLGGHPAQVFTRAVANLPVAHQARLAPEVDRIDLQSRHWVGDKGHNYPVFVDMTVQCRRCPTCLQRRARLWAHKAQEEMARASRTWFATYTASPDQHYRWRTVARMARLEASAPFDGETDAIEFRELVAAAGADLTRYWKRVRKQSGAPIRYFCVAEKHTEKLSGLPHFHALIHEVDPARPIRKAVLKDQWTCGFSRFKLVEDRSMVWYLCKYLSKDMDARVRASLWYGKEPSVKGSIANAMRGSLATSELAVARGGKRSVPRALGTQVSDLLIDKLETV